MGSPESEANLEPHAPDYALIAITLALLCIGIVMVYSASLVARYAQFGDQTYFFQRQLMWCGAGVVVMFLSMRLPYRWWRRLSVRAHGGRASAGLWPYSCRAWDHSLGRHPLDPRRRASRGPAVGVMQGDAGHLHGRLARGAKASGARIPLWPAALPGDPAASPVLVMKQPDMGTALVIIATAVTIFFVSGANLLQLIPWRHWRGAAWSVLAISPGYRSGRHERLLETPGRTRKTAAITWSSR